MWSTIRELGNRVAQALGVEVPELPDVQDVVQDTLQEAGAAVEPLATQAQDAAQPAAEQVTGAAESAAGAVTDTATSIKMP